MRALYLYGVTNDGEYGKTIEVILQENFVPLKKSILSKN